MSLAFSQGYECLNDFQKKIFEECIVKGSGGLSLPLGSGKSLLSMVVALKQTMEDESRILVVVSKSLVASWVHEIKKFFGETLNYEIVHQSSFKESRDLDFWKIKNDTKLVLTTPEVLSKYYKENNVDKMFIEKQQLNTVPPTIINYYRDLDQPFLNHNVGGGILFSIKWGCFIVDEVQRYTQITTLRCQSLGAIIAKNRWALSGTLFDEPTAERVLGYHIILNLPGVPRNLPDMKFILNNNLFQGLNATIVHRDKNEPFTPPKVNKKIITHSLTFPEAKIYTTMRKILIQVKNRAMRAQLLGNKTEQKLFNSYKLVMVTYLRQALVCPLIPIASIAIDASDLQKKSELSKLIMDEVRMLHIDAWLNDIDSVKSSRIRSALTQLDKHQNEKVIIFSCYKSCLDILETYIPTDRKLIRLKASMSIDKRGEIIEEFRQTDNGVLLLTYQLGSEGLNLQFAATVFLLDFWWNAARSQQAIGRIFRYGQIADEINVYLFSSNTGVENIIFKKQEAKLRVLDELKVGSIQTKVPFLKMNEVIRLIEMNKNQTLLNNIDYY